MKKLTTIILSLTIMMMSSSVLAKKKLYKWVDENGKITYSDRVPKKQISKKHEELSGNGIVLESIANARTKEEIRADRELKIKQKEEKQRAAEIERERQIIIMSYTSEKELIRLKDERIFALERNVELAKQSLKFQNTSKEQLLSRAADDERNGKEISKALKSRIKIVEDQMKYQAEFINAKNQEMKKVNTKFKKDLAIYRDAVNTK